MTARRDPDRLIRTYLDDGPTELADRSYDAVRAQIDHLRQRAVFGPWREPHMSKFVPVVLVAAAVLVVAVLGINFLPRQGGVGGASTSPTSAASLTPTPSPTQAATEVPSSAPTPAALSNHGEIEAGSYTVRPFYPPNESISFTFTVPDGWLAAGNAGRAPSGIFPQKTGHEAPGGMALGFAIITSLENDPCQWSGASRDEVGPRVSDLAEALRRNGAYRVSTPVDVILGGYDGVRVDVEIPAEIDLAACDHDGQFWVFGDVDGHNVYAQGPEMRYHLWILDVQGDRVIVMTHDFPGTSTEDRTELQAIVDSIRIDR